MPAPETSLVTQRPDLAASFQEFDLDMASLGLISTQVLPVIEVAKQSGNYGKIPVEQLKQKRELLRAPGSGYNRGNFTFQTATYACKEYGAEEPIDDREAAMYSDYFDAEQVSAARARHAVMIEAEQRVADAIFNTTTWTGAALTSSGAFVWSNTGSATPITDVEGAVMKVYENSGLRANAVIMSWRAFREARLTDQVIDKIKYAGFQNPDAGSITAQALANMFAVDMVLVAGETKNTANEGAAASLAAIWDESMAMVCRVATTQDFREPAIGRTFHWGEDGSSIGGTFESYRDESVRSDVIRVRHDVDEIVSYVEAGHLLTGL